MARARTRLSEPDARILALRIAAAKPNHQASTAEIKEAIPRYVELTEADLRPSATRPHEEKWQQIVGNVVSHQDSSTSIFRRGLSERTRNGIRVTELGLEFLRRRGFYDE